jgi:transcription-repair coupling factor (superfamily II helicase)
VNVRLDFDAFIPASYIPDERQRLGIYRRLSEAGEDAAVAALAEELRDRFGPRPVAVDHLLTVRKISLWGAGAGVRAVNISGPLVTLEFGKDEFERASTADVPGEVTGVDVKAGRGGKTFVTFTVGEGAAVEDVTLAMLARFAEGADEVQSSQEKDAGRDG